MVTPKKEIVNCQWAHITKTQAVYLDQRHWDISVIKTDQMEISCSYHTHDITINPQ